MSKLIHVMLDDAAQVSPMPLVEAPEERIAEIEEDEDIFAGTAQGHALAAAVTMLVAIPPSVPLNDEEAADSVFEEQQDSNH